MAGFIQNIIWNSVEGFVEAGTRTAGEYAGNALIKAGDMVENGGRGVGNSIERRATAYGSSISGQTYKPSPKALPSTARKPVVKRSNSLPASSKLPTTKSLTNGGTVKKQNTSSTPLGQKKITNGTGNASKPSIPPFKGASANGSLANKPSSNSTSNLPAKKTAVKPGIPKPFVPPANDKKKVEDRKKAGGSAYPGQGSRVPVQQQRQKYKPMQRMGPQVEQGQQMNHIAI